MRTTDWRHGTWSSWDRLWDTLLLAMLIHGLWGIFSEPLYLAIARGDVTRMARYLEGGGNPNRTFGNARMSLLEATVKWRNDEGMRLLFQRGVDVDYRDGQGNTALHYACSYSNVHAVKSLLEGGASVNARNLQMWTPLDEARIRQLDYHRGGREEEGMIAGDICRLLEAAGGLSGKKVS